MADEEERTRICDQCHKEVAVSNFALHESHCQRFLCLCPDCDEPVPRELLDQHHQNQHSQVKCDKKVESCQLLDHECKARLQRCEFCPVELPLSAMAEHSLACGSRTERCSDCGRYITLRDQPEHGQICPDLNAPDNPSPPSSNGRRTAVVCRSCTRSFPLEEMAEHQLECDHTSEESKGDDDDEEDGSHKQEQASPRLTSSMKSTLFSAQGKRQEGEVDQISTCPHCHLALPVVTLRWHEKLTLDLNNSHESVDEELLEVVLLCSRLVYLKVWAFLDISFLDRLLQKRLEKKTILRTIKVRIYTNKYETQDEDGQLEEVYSRYRQLINSELHYLAISYPML